jgi:hypothetical protein
MSDDDNGIKCEEQEVSFTEIHNFVSLFYSVDRYTSGTEMVEMEIEGSK